MSLFAPEDKMNSPCLSELFLNSFSNSCFFVVGIIWGYSGELFCRLKDYIVELVDIPITATCGIREQYGNTICWVVDILSTRRRTRTRKLFECPGGGLVRV